MTTLLLFCFFFPLLFQSIAAQEAPTLNLMDVFDYNSSYNFRTNVCSRQALLSDGQIELRHALQGLNLSVALDDYAHTGWNEENFFALSPDGTIDADDPGLFVVILDEIARRAGFQWRHSYAAVPPPPADRSWSDLLQWEVTHFDIAVDYWAKSVERMSRGIAFPHGWYDGSIVMVAREQVFEDPFDVYSFLVPFEWTIWCAIVGAIFMTGLIYFFLERLDPTADERNLEDKPWTNIFLAALTFTGHMSYQPNTTPSRILVMSWGFWTIIVLSAYTANMASFLVSQNSKPPRISTIEEALLTSTPLCVQRGAVIDDLLTDKYPELNLVRKDTEGEMFDGLGLGWYSGKGGCGALLTNLGTYDVYRTQDSTNADCSLASDQRVLMSLPAGFATAVDSAIQCTSLISYVMDVHLQEMRQDGFIDRAWDAHIEKVATKTCPAVTQSFADSRAAKASRGFSLTIKDMGGIFCFHFAMSALALLFAFYQRFQQSRLQPEKKLRPIQMDKAVSAVKENLEESARSISVVSKNLHLDESFRTLSRKASDMTSRRNLNSSSNLGYNHSESLGSFGSGEGASLAGVGGKDSRLPAKNFRWSVGDRAEEFEDSEDLEKEDDNKFWAN